jgi:hypothetical protein
MAATLVDIHLNDPEQSTSLLLPFTVAFFDHLSLFVSQMRVVAVSVTHSRRHWVIEHHTHHIHAAVALIPGICREVGSF